MHHKVESIDIQRREALLALVVSNLDIDFSLINPTTEVCLLYKHPGYLVGIHFLPLVIEAIKGAQLQPQEGQEVNPKEAFEQDSDRPLDNLADLRDLLSEIEDYASVSETDVPLSQDSKELKAQEPQPRVVSWHQPE